MLSRVARLNRTLSEARLLLDAIDQNEESLGSTEHSQFLRCIRRLGFILSSVKNDLYAKGDSQCDPTTEEAVRSAEEFLHNLISTHLSDFDIPISCVGLMVSARTLREPFAGTCPFLSHEASVNRCVRAHVSDCTFHHDEQNHSLSKKTFPVMEAPPAAPAAAAAPSPAPSVALLGHEQVMEEIRTSIKGMKEGALRVSGLMREERERLDTNAALLQRSVDGARAQSRQIETVSAAFGGSASMPSFLRSLPGAAVMWETLIAPLWAVLKQAIFITAIIAVTFSLLFLMVVSPKKYVYAQ